MKVLYVDHPEADMQAATIFVGLRQELGDDNVVDWPYKPSYHGIVDTFYVQPNGNPGLTAPFPWVPASTCPAWSIEEVATRIGEFDIVILASPRESNRLRLQELIRVVGRSAIKRLVIMDGEDYDHVRWDYVDEFTPRLYFKREMLTWHRDPRARVVPFPFASPVSPAPTEKSYDVVFLGGGNFPGGREVLDKVLRSELGDRYLDGSKRLPDETYFQTLCRAKIAVATRGHGWDALRLWEVPSCPGTLMLRDRTPLIQPRPFVDGVTCAFFDRPEDVAKVALKYLENEPLRAQVAAAGNEWIRQHHSARARARQLIEESMK